MLSSWELSSSDNILKWWQTTQHGKISVVCLALDSGVPCAFSVLFLLFYWSWPEKKNDSNDSRSMTTTDDSQVEKIANTPIPAFFFTNFVNSLLAEVSHEEAKMRGGRDHLLAPDALFDEAADQISDRNLSVFKTGSVFLCKACSTWDYCFCFLFFRLLLLSLNLM